MSESVKEKCENMSTRNKLARRRNSLFAGTTGRLCRPTHIDPRRNSEPITLVCKPCKEKGTRTEATKCCGLCQIYMCNTCLQGHNLHSKRSHSLQEGRKNNNNVHYECVRHKSKIIKYFCINHNILGCSECVTTCHKRCSSVQYIPEIAEKSGEQDMKEEYENIVDTLNSLYKHAQKNTSGLCEKKKSIEDMREKALSKFKTLRQQLNELLDNAEKEIENLTQEMRDRDMEKVVEQSEEYDYISTNIENLLTELNQKHSTQQNHELFVAMKTAATNVELIEEKLADLEGSNLINHFDFVPEREIQKILRGNIKLGSIQKNPEVNYVTDIIQQSPKNKANCWTTGLAALTNDILVVTDHEHSCIKMVDTKSHKVLSKLVTTSPPWDITRIDHQTLAVTIPDEKRIQIVDVHSKLSISISIPVHGDCCGIAYADKKLYVTYTDPAIVQILNMQGKVQKTISTDQQGQSLFSNPFYITVSPDQNHMYVSDVKEHTVTCLTVEGVVVNSYKSYSLTGPLGLAADKLGNIYVCGGWSKTIHCLQPDCSQGRDILRNMTEPQSITISQNQKNFYVGKLDSNKISMYEMD